MSNKKEQTLSALAIYDGAESHALTQEEANRVVNDALREVYLRDMAEPHPIIAYIASLPPREPTPEERFGITPAMKLWAKYYDIPAENMETWPHNFQIQLPHWREAFEHMAEPHWDETPREADFDDEGYQPSIQDLLNWRDREERKIKAAKLLGLEHKTDEKMLAYYNEQAELAQQFTYLNPAFAHRAS